MPSSLHRDLQFHLLKKLSFFLPKREVRFGSINRTADILIESKRLIFEIQCSAISRKEVMMRNADYEQRGYRTIWILHTKQFGRKNASPAEKYLEDREHYYSNFAASGGEIFDNVRFPKKSWLRYNNPVRIETISPFIQTRGTTAVRKNAQYYCKGDIVDLLMNNSETAEAVIERLYPPKISVGKRITNYLKILFESELMRHCN